MPAPAVPRDVSSHVLPRPSRQTIVARAWPVNRFVKVVRQLGLISGRLVAALASRQERSAVGARHIQVGFSGHWSAYQRVPQRWQMKMPARPIGSL